MKNISLELAASLDAPGRGKIAPAWFFYVRARNFTNGVIEDMAVWSGDEDYPITVIGPDGNLVSRTYIGQCNLTVSGIQYVADLTDNPVEVTLAGNRAVAEFIARGHDLRMAYCEVHATTWNGGALTSAPELQWIGIVDDASINLPQAGGGGTITLSLRSEIMHQLTAVNPAKSSDEHQKRRNWIDDFCKYSGIIGTRDLQWYKD